MKQLGIPYQLTEAPDRLKNAHLDNIAIIPASMLFQSNKVKAAANRLTTGSVLIVPPHQSRQRKILESVASFFQGHGHKVTTIPIDLIMNNQVAVS